jgi:hypothetical protein
MTYIPSCTRPILSRISSLRKKFLHSWRNRLLNVLISSATTPRTRISVRLYSDGTRWRLTSSVAGMRTLNNIGSDADSKLQQFKNKFTDLKAAFQGRGVLETEIMVVRILDEVEHLGMNPIWCRLSICI